MNKNKNLLPPFLMIRSGLLHDYAFMLTLIAGMGVVVCEFSSKPLSYRAAIIPGIISLVAFIIATVRTDRKRTAMKEDIESLLAHIDGFKSGIDDFSVYGTRFPKMTERVIQYASKQDNSMFQRIIEHPDFLQNTKIATDIAIGHLKKNPSDATKVNTNLIDINMVPPRLYNKIVQINPNLRQR